MVQVLVPTLEVVVDRLLLDMMLAGTEQQASSLLVVQVAFLYFQTASILVETVVQVGTMPHQGQAVRLLAAVLVVQALDTLADRLVG